MDKIKDRKSFEVGGLWPLWQNRQKSNAKKIKYYVNGDVAKTGNKSSIHCGFL